MALGLFIVKQWQQYIIVYQVSNVRLTQSPHYSIQLPVRMAQSQQYPSLRERFVIQKKTQVHFQSILFF